MTNSLYSLENSVAEPFAKTRYQKEDDLQNIVAQNPNLLILPTDPDDYQLYLVAREQPIPCPDRPTLWADVFFVDSLAVPVIVEVKRSSDTRIHAEVMTQTLNYAAHLCYADFDKIITNIQASIKKLENENPLPNDDSCEESGSFLNHAFIEKLRENIVSGIMKLIIVADEIPSSLEHIIKFADHAMKDIAVYGVEIPQYTVNSKTVLTRSFVVTQQVEEKKKSSTPSMQWTKESMLKRFQECGNLRGIDNLSKIMPLAEHYGFNAVYGSGSTIPTITFKLQENTVFYLEFGLNEKGAGIMSFPHNKLILNYPNLFHEPADVRDYLVKNGFDQKELRVGKNITSFYLRMIQSEHNYNAIEALFDYLSKNREE